MTKSFQRWRKTFAKPINNDDWYDIVEDWPLIESSFFKQYGIRLRTINDMSWDEFCSYLAGIMPDTPLGNIVQIRCEEDKKILKEFTKEQRKIHSEWRNRRAHKVSHENAAEAIEQFKKMFEQLAKGGE